MVWWCSKPFTHSQTHTHTAAPLTLSVHSSELGASAQRWQEVQQGPVCKSFRVSKHWTSQMICPVRPIIISQNALFSPFPCVSQPVISLQSGYRLQSSHTTANLLISKWDRAGRMGVQSFYWRESPAEFSSNLHNTGA